jgi:hypothetical protein
MRCVILYQPLTKTKRIQETICFGQWGTKKYKSRETEVQESYCIAV